MEFVYYPLVFHSVFRLVYKTIEQALKKLCNANYDGLYN